MIAEQIDIVRKLVEEFYIENAPYTGLMFQNLEEREHIITIGTSILCTKWGVGYQGGGFVQAFVSNDLQESIGRADGTSLKGFKFFGQLIYNTPMPTFEKEILRLREGTDSFDSVMANVLDNVLGFDESNEVGKRTNL